MLAGWNQLLCLLVGRWPSCFNSAYVLLCHGAHVLLGEHDCPASRRMLVDAVQASSAAEVVGFRRWFGKESDLCLSASRLLFSLCTGINSMICCRKGVALLRGWCDSKHPGHQQLVGTGAGRWGWPHAQLLSPRAGELCFLCGLSTRSVV